MGESPRLPSPARQLAELHAEDRREHADVPPEYRALGERDRRRRERAIELLDRLEASGTSSPEDLCHAA